MKSTRLNLAILVASLFVFASMTTQEATSVRTKSKRQSNNRQFNNGRVNGAGPFDPRSSSFNNNNNNNNRKGMADMRVRTLMNLPDNWDRIPSKAQTYNEPQHYYLMPHLSNGILGTTAKNDSLYMNGLYNGLQERSHRVRIPSMTAIHAELGFAGYYDPKISYNFDYRRGTYSIETRTQDVFITHKYYVHRRLRNIAVTEIRVELLSRTAAFIYLINQTKLELNVSYLNQPLLNPNRFSYYYQSNNPEMMSFEHRVVLEPTILGMNIEQNDGIHYLQATIPQLETNQNQKRPKQIHTYYTNVPRVLEIYPNTTVKTFHFIQSVDTDGLRAKSAYDEALRLVQNDPNGLHVTHSMAWEEVWSKNGMAALTDTTFVDQNHESFKLAQRLYASFYNLYAAIPMAVDNQFYGVSPAGLAYGGLKSEFFNSTPLHQPSTQFASNRHVSEGYGGHIMYNQELWILPLISMFSSEMSKNLINSRLRRGLNVDSLNVYEQAREAAKQESLEGLRYPWEQGDYGVEVSPLKDAKNKMHTSADISFGIRHYLRMTHNREFLLQSVMNDVALRGEDYLKELAVYWNNRFEYDFQSNQYVLKSVSFGEKSRNREVDNEAYTNFMAALSMDTYKYALNLSSNNPYESQNINLIREFDDKMQRVRLPYEHFSKLFLEHENFNEAQQNEETLVPFLNYPVQRLFSYEEKKALYDKYASQLTNDGSHSLAYASYVVGYLELNEDHRAKEYMHKLVSHFAGPFHVMTEYPHVANNLNPQNTFHYMAGYAAFAHTFIAGHCGLRVRDFQLDLVYPSEHFTNYVGMVGGTQHHSLFKQPATNVESWNITGLNYRGNKLDIVYNLRSRSVEIRNRRSADMNAMASDNSLEVVVYEGHEPVVKQLRVGDSVSVSLTSDLWKFIPNKDRLQYRNSYTNNMHILASIYSSNHLEKIARADATSPSASRVQVATMAALVFAAAKLARLVSY